VIFRVAAEAYDRFMGRYSAPLAATFVDFAALPPDARVLDVGCGPGALTSELTRRFGTGGRITAAEPSPEFVEAARTRFPGIDVHQAPAEDLPFHDADFDAALAQLVVHFMADPVRGLGEMRRVTRAGGVVAACVWDHGGGTGPSSLLWASAKQVDPDAPDEDRLPGSVAGDLTRLFEEAGLQDVQEERLAVRVQHPDFDEWWERFTLGVGPAGAYVGSLDDERRAALREQCRAAVPPAPFTIEAAAWAARGII
jgi:SAM-dependent methyltransferase